MANSGIRHTVSSTPVSRSQYESEEHHTIVSGGSFPASPVERQLFYRTDLHRLYIYNGTTWIDCSYGSSDVDNAISTHSSLATGVHGTGSNYVAQAPSSGHLVRNFTKGWTSGYYLKGTGINQDPSEIQGNLSCKVYRSTAQSIPYATLTAVAFDAESWDYANMHDNAVNNSRITAPATGVYFASAAIVFDANATGTRLIMFKKSGAEQDSFEIPALTGGAYTRLFLASVYSLAQSDYLEAHVYQTSGGNLNIIVGRFAVTRLLI